MNFDNSWAADAKEELNIFDISRVQKTLCVSQLHSRKNMEAGREVVEERVDEGVIPKRQQVKTYEKTCK